jgi:hypothetical protein
VPCHRLLFCAEAWQWLAWRNDLLALRQYGLLDHVPRFNIERKCNIPLSAIALRHIGKGDEKASGTFDDPDVMDQ